MKSVKFKILFLFFLFLFSCFFLSQAFAEDNGTDKMTSELTAVETRLANLEKGQQDILTKEDKILEELARVRVVAHRR